MKRGTAALHLLAAALGAAGGMTVAQMQPPLAALPQPAVPVAEAREHGRIKGTVSDDHRRPLPAAWVLALSTVDGRRLILLTTTDGEGAYSFNGLPPGIYALQAGAEGQAPANYADIEVRPPFRNILDMRLKAAPGSPPGSTVARGPGVPGGAGLAAVISGSVSGEAEVAVADAEISLVGGPPPGQHLVLSREDGTFALEQVPGAVYELRITAPGAIPVLVPDFSVEPGLPLELQVRLVDFPLELVSRRRVILPLVEPLPPLQRRALPPLAP